MVEIFRDRNPKVPQTLATQKRTKVVISPSTREVLEHTTSKRASEKNLAISRNSEKVSEKRTNLVRTERELAKILGR